MLVQMWFSHEYVPESVRTEMEIAVGEISANIIEHAAKERPLRLRMEVRVLPDKVQVSRSTTVRRRTWTSARRR